MSGLDFDIAVLGGGCVGTSIFFELCRQGLGSVALVDRDRATHATGSQSATASSGGMIRAVHESPLHTELALESFERLGAHAKTGVLPTLSATGSLYFLRRERLDDYAASLAALRAASHAHELIDAERGRELHPEFVWRDGDCAIFEPSAGRLDPATYVARLKRAAQRACPASGAVAVLDDFEVRRICRYLDRYRISGDAATITARTLVLAGGARGLGRLADLGIALPLESRELRVFVGTPESPQASHPQYFDRETLEHASFGPGPEVLTSTRRPTKLVRPLWTRITGERRAFDCYAPDRMGLLGRVPGQAGLIIATGWGGTAFKLAPALGVRAARIIAREFFERRSHHACIAST